MVTEATVPVLGNDGITRNVRNLAITFVDAEGTAFTANMQVVSVADENGNILSLSRTEELLEQVVGEIRRLRETLTLEGIALA